MYLHLLAECSLDLEREWYFSLSDNFFIANMENIYFMIFYLNLHLKNGRPFN